MLRSGAMLKRWARRTERTPGITPARSACHGPAAQSPHVELSGHRLHRRRDLRDLVDSRERGDCRHGGSGLGFAVDLAPGGSPTSRRCKRSWVPGSTSSRSRATSFSAAPGGVIVGRRELVERLKKNPWNRALRIDKLHAGRAGRALYEYDGPGAADVRRPEADQPWPAVRPTRPARGVQGARDVRAALAVRVVRDRAQVGGGALPTVGCRRQR